MTQQDVYLIRAYYNDGSIEETDNFDRNRLIKLELIPLREHLSKVTLVIDKDKEIIFYRRRIKNLLTDKLEKTIYFIGYIKKEHKYLLSIDSNTGEVRIEDDSFRQT